MYFVVLITLIKRYINIVERDLHVFPKVRVSCTRSMETNDEAAEVNLISNFPLGPTSAGFPQIRRCAEETM